MVRLLFGVSLCFLISVQYVDLFAQETTITGTLKDATLKEPISGAFFDIGDEDGLTGADGRFTIIGTFSSSDIIVFKYLGYEDLSYPIPQAMNGTIQLGDIFISEHATRLREVMVGAEAMPYRGTHQGTNYYISPRVLKEIQPLSTEEVLRTLPGVNVVGDMGLSNRPNISIRGSWGRRSEKVLLLEDGSPVSPAPYIAPGVYYNPISDRIDAIEVYTGSDLLRYGPNNMFGIINYISPKPPQIPTLRAKIAGGNNGFFTGLLSYGGTWNKVGVSVEGVYKRFDGFVENSSVEMMNLSSKIYAELSPTQSIYLKVSGQIEDNQASLSAITPLTFGLQPTANPFDADRFTMYRYGLDLIHKWLPGEGWSLVSKLFASDFARDWWRQNNAVIPATQVRSYLGDQIYFEKYRYLESQEFGVDDMVRVGRLTNGRESTTDSRWHFTVAGIEETLKREWRSDRGADNDLEFNLKIHRETYSDNVISADSSRWARSGRISRDIDYALNSLSGYFRYQYSQGNFALTPIFRVEKVWMSKADLLKESTNPDSGSEKEAEIVNSYTVFLPGISLSYQTGDFKWFASAYQGYIAPSKNFAFLVERDGVVTVPEFGQAGNMKPELNINVEIGARGDFIPDRISGQIAVFRNHIRNFYLAGWNEYFDKLGQIEIYGLEAALRFSLHKNVSSVHQFFIQPNLTVNRSRVLSGELLDRHLFSQIVHSSATKAEFVDRFNANPEAFKVYMKDDMGNEVLFSGIMEEQMLHNITSTYYLFGKGKIENGRVPYTPDISCSMQLNYRFKSFSTSLTWNYIGNQYTEFANFRNESADGSLGMLDGFQTLDFNVNYDMKLSGTQVSFFLAGKNITNHIFKMSRLNRANSGIFPGGFRQINAGMNLLF